MTKSGTVRCGIGGWTFDPWDDSFYPTNLPKKRQLEHASRQLTAIEVNGPLPNGPPKCPKISSSH